MGRKRSVLYSTMTKSCTLFTHGEKILISRRPTLGTVPEYTCEQFLLLMLLSANGE